MGAQHEVEHGAEHDGHDRGGSQPPGGREVSVLGDARPRRR